MQPTNQTRHLLSYVSHSAQCSCVTAVPGCVVISLVINNSNNSSLCPCESFFFPERTMIIGISSGGPMFNKRISWPSITCTNLPVTFCRISTHSALKRRICPPRSAKLVTLVSQRRTLELRTGLPWRSMKQANSVRGRSRYSIKDHCRKWRGSNEFLTYRRRLPYSHSHRHERGRGFSMHRTAISSSTYLHQTKPGWSPVPQAQMNSINYITNQTFTNPLISVFKKALTSLGQSLWFRVLLRLRSSLTMV